MSSHAVHYKSQMEDKLDRVYEAKLLEEGYGGSEVAQIASNDMLDFGFLKQGDPKFERIKATTCVYSVIDQGQFTFSDTFTSDNKKFILEIYLDSSLHWKGYVLPETFAQAYDEPPVRVDIKASDGLSVLQGVDHSFTGKVTGMDVITACQDEIGFALDIWDATYIFPDGADTTESALHEYQFNSERWFKGDDPFDLLRVLDEVLKTQLAQIFQAEGAWHIVPFELRGKTYDRVRYNSSGVKQEYESDFDPVVNAVKTDRKEGVWTDHDAVLKPKPAKKNIEVDNDIGPIGNLVTNGNFDWDDFDRDVSGAPTVPTDWEDNGLDFGVIQTDLEGTNAYINLAGGVRSGTGGYLSVQDKELAPQTGDKLSTKFKVRYLQGSGPGLAEFRFAIRVGSKWLSGPAGSYSWEDTLTLVSLDVPGVDTNGPWSEFEIETPEIPETGELEFRLYDYNVQFVGGQMNIAKWVTNYLVDDVASTERFTTFIKRDINANAQPVEYKLLHGDAPASVSPGALFFNGNLTENWNRRGETDDEPLRNIIAQTLAKMHQNQAWGVIGSLQGNHTWLNAILDQTRTYIPIGGTFKAKTLSYRAQWVQFFSDDIDVGGFLSEVIDRETSTFGGTTGGPVEFRDEIGIRVNAVGQLTEDVDGTAVTSIPVQLKSPVRVNWNYYIINEPADDDIPISIADPGGGVTQFDAGLYEDADEIPIDEQRITAPEGSWIVEAGGQRNVEDQLFQEKIESLNTSLDDLNDNKIPQLEANLDTLDGYFNDPDTIPDGYSFFEGIVSNEVWAQTGVFMQGWFDQIVANNLFTDRITSNHIDTDELAANSGFITTLMAQDLILQSNGFIRSTSYSAGSDGFRIKANGDVEFNDGTFRGTIIVTGGDAATETYADGAADDAIEDVSVVIRSDTKPSDRPNGKSLRQGDTWIETDEGDRAWTWDTGANDFIQQFTEIDGGFILTNTIKAASIDVSDLFAENITVTGDLQSENFSAGSAGWKIDGANDDAEFNDVTIRGSLWVGGTINDGTFGGTNTLSGTLTGGDIKSSSIDCSIGTGCRFTSMPTAPDGFITRHLWYDTSDGNTVKYVPP